MLSILWNLAAFIVALGVLITVHEFGHFWVARRCGVRVERFSIGFGKALWRAPTSKVRNLSSPLFRWAATSKCSTNA
jgi:RIP metalloprotease RseP